MKLSRRSRTKPVGERSKTLASRRETFRSTTMVLDSTPAWPPAVFRQESARPAATYGVRGQRPPAQERGLAETGSSRPAKPGILHTLADLPLAPAPDRR